MKKTSRNLWTDGRIGRLNKSLHFSKMSVNQLTQSLANSLEQSQRDVAIDNVFKWIKAQKSIEEVDLLKLWQGIWYCYWLADKQGYQDSLVTIFTECLVSMKEQNAMLYLKTFYETLAKNWPNLDKHRYIIITYLSLELQNTCLLSVNLQIKVLSF